MGRDAFSQCHPLTNFLFFLGAIGFGVVIQHPAYLLMGCVCAASYYWLLSGRKAVGFLLGMVPVFLMISLLNPLFNTYGSHILFRVFGRPYCLEALLYGMVIAGMFVLMMLWFACYSQVLTSDKFVSLFGSLIPSLSLLLVMVLRMIPNLMRKAGQISGARKSIGKGVGAQSSNKEKVVDGMHILSALTDWALEGSLVTADSMRSRGYGAARRTSFHLYRMTVRDAVLIAAMVLLALAVLAAGGTTAQFTPQLHIDKLTWGFWAYCAFLWIPTGMHLVEAVKWNISISKI